MQEKIMTGVLILFVVLLGAIGGVIGGIAASVYDAYLVKEAVIDKFDVQVKESSSTTTPELENIPEANYEIKDLKG